MSVAYQHTSGDCWRSTAYAPAPLPPGDKGRGGLPPGRRVAKTFHRFIRVGHEKFIVIDGGNRFGASVLAGFTHVPVVVEEAQT